MFESGQTKLQLQQFISVRLCDCVQPDSNMVKMIDIEQIRTGSNRNEVEQNQSQTATIFR